MLTNILGSTSPCQCWCNPSDSSTWLAVVAHPRHSRSTAGYSDLALRGCAACTLCPSFATSTGIDIAYLLSGAAYHTQTDTLDAIRPGVLQETGQAMTAAVWSLATALAAAAAASEAGGDTAAAGVRSAQLEELLSPTDHRRMFVSIGGATMITYSSSLARLLHNLPLALVLSTPHTLQLLSPSTVSKERSVPYKTAW